MKNYFILLLVLCSCRMTVAQSFEGSWKGSLVVSAMELPLIFEFKYNGVWEGTMQSPMQSNAKIPLSRIENRGDSIFVELKQAGLSYKGKLNQERNAIEGTFQQRTLKAPMVLTRLSAAQAEAAGTFKRSQRVKPPYSYDTLNVNFENTIDKVTLAGTMTSPKEKGRYPAVVLVTGSGPQDRNSTALGHEPFKVLADYLTKQGIIVLRYDDRGIAQSTGKYQTATTGDFGKDALAGLQFLRKQAKVDPNKVGIIGHSEGGLISLILAGQHVAGLDFIVSLNGPAIRIDSLMIMQAEAVERSMGRTLTPAMKEKVLRNYEIAKSDLTTEKAFQAIMSNMKVIEGSQNVAFADEIGVLVTPWYRHFLKIDPVQFIKKIKVPVFASFGGKDIQVIAVPNMESMTDNLPKGTKSEIKIYPDLNHMNQHANTGAVAEYAEIEETISPELMQDVANWIKGLK